METNRCSGCLKITTLGREIGSVPRSLGEKHCALVGAGGGKVKTGERKPRNENSAPTQHPGMFAFVRISYCCVTSAENFLWPQPPNPLPPTTWCSSPAQISEQKAQPNRVSPCMGMASRQPPLAPWGGVVSCARGDQGAIPLSSLNLESMWNSGFNPSSQEEPGHILPTLLPFLRSERCWLSAGEGWSVASGANTACSYQIQLLGSAGRQMARGLSTPWGQGDLDTMMGSVIQAMELMALTQVFIVGGFESGALVWPWE